MGAFGSFFAEQCFKIFKKFSNQKPNPSADFCGTNTEIARILGGRRPDATVKLKNERPLTISIVEDPGGEMREKKK